jgi:hypothetical protein
MTSLVVGIMKLDLAILWGRVGTRYPKLDTVREEEGAGGVIKLTSIIARTTKLRRHIGDKVRKGGERVRLMAQWKGL